MKGNSLLLIILLAFSFATAKTVVAGTTESKSNDSFSWAFEYDNYDRISKLIDPAGRATEIGYSVDNSERLRKLVITTEDDLKVIHEFDKIGRRSKMQDGVGTVSYEYNDLDRQIRVLRQGLPTISYTFDRFDRINNLLVGDFYHIEYIYDFLGRLEFMNTPAGVISYEYLTERGQLIRTLPNGVKTISEYEPNGELRRITHALSSKSKDNDYQILAEYSYQYRPDGLIDSIQEFSSVGKSVQIYEYDKVGRLFRAIGPQGRKYAFEYDQIGNRITSTSPGKPQQNIAHDWLGRVTSINGIPSKHDAVGNLTALSIDGKTLKYRYDQHNQLTEVVNANVRYQYDGDGQLIGRISGENKLSFISNPMSSYWQPLAIKDKNGHQTLVVWDGTAPLILIRDNKPEYLLHDHLGSVRLAVDDNVKVSRKIDYHPFGSIRDSSIVEDFAPRFAGLFWDPQANIYLTRARAYSSDLGRFLQIDPQYRVPYGSQKDLSIYGYCGNDPINYVDKTGLYPVNIGIGPSGFYPFPFNPHNFSRPILTLIDPASVAQASGVIRPIIFGPEGFNPNIFNQPVSGGAGIDVSSLNLGLNDNIVGKGSSNFIASKGGVFGGGWADRARGTGGKVIDVLGGLLGGVTGAPTLPPVLEPKGGVVKPPGPLVWPPGADRPPKPKGNKGIRGGNKPGGNKPTPRPKPGGPGPRTGPMKSSQLAAFNFIASKGGVFKGGFGDWARGTGGKVIDVLGGLLGGVTGAPTLPPVLEPKGVVVIPPGPVVWPPGADRPPKPKGNKGIRGGNKPGGNKPTPRPKPGGPGPRTGPMKSSQLATSGLVPNINLLRPSIQPSTVGGVYLGGASQTLESVGLLEGISLDSNNNLILLSKTGEDIDLPPLRIDDLVTVFRSVYLHGTGPSVTIDPNPEDPEGSAMIVRHGKATENTYVGWVLFQADRLMKGYSLGADNETAQQITSIVPGYDEVLDTTYFGGESPQYLSEKGHWQRFWIVPAAARRYGTDKTELTLFDVPLKVKTQTMKWEKGKLVDDRKGKSSPGALAFTVWFTEKYGQIAEEQYLTPPPQSGIIKPVPVFTELRRIALITAIAEKLRNQGIPMPFWMHDYEIRPVPIENFTPALEVTRSNQLTTARAFGGVELSAKDKDTRDFRPGTNLAKLPKAEQKSVRNKIKLIGDLDKAIQNNMTSAGSLTVRQFKHKGDSYQAVSLPGSDTLALSPARMDEVDLSVPIEGGRSIRLMRHYNSFFDPNGSLGKGWTQNLPRLLKTRVPVRREDGKTSYRLAYELITPLNSTYTRFSRVENVSELNNNSLLVSDYPSNFFGLAEGQPDFLSGPTLMLIRKDGSIWHFTKSGSLVAIEDGGFQTVYERDGSGKLIRIVGLLGKQKVALIEMNYDTSGKLVYAKGRKTGLNPTETFVRYQYDNTSRLSGIVSGFGALGYRYQGSRVKAVSYQPKDTEGKLSREVMVHNFEYNRKGQLLSEIAVDGTKTTYKIVSDDQGSTIIALSVGDTSRTNSISYDPEFRPIKAKFAYGAQVSWTYLDTGASIVDIKESDGSVMRLKESADKRRRTLEFDKKRKVTSKFDKAGRMISLSENGRTLLEQQWAPSGQLQVAKNEILAEHFEYDVDGLVSRVIQAPSSEGGELNHWQATKFDPAGRPVEITDHRGMYLSMGFNVDGELDEMVTRRDGKSYGFKINHDRSGRIQEVQSSWEKQQFAYDAAGLLRKLTLNKYGKEASAEWRSGLLRNVTQFDGSDHSLDYYDDGKLKNITIPNQLNLTYKYDKSHRLSEVAIGDAGSMVLNYNDKGNLTRWGYRAF